MAEVPLPTPTDNPVPSTDIRDAVYAGAMLDKVVTSTELTYTDRLGGEHYTVDGIKAEGDKVVEETRQNLIPLSRQYMTLADAQADIANIPEGSTTYVRSPDGGSLADEYINNGGTLEATGRAMPSQKYIDALIQQSDRYGVDIRFLVDAVLAGMTLSGSIKTAGSTAIDKQTIARIVSASNVGTTLQYVEAVVGTESIKVSLLPGDTFSTGELTTKFLETDIGGTTNLGVNIGSTASKIYTQPSLAPNAMFSYVNVFNVFDPAGVYPAVRQVDAETVSVPSVYGHSSGFIALAVPNSVITGDGYALTDDGVKAWFADKVKSLRLKYLSSVTSKSYPRDFIGISSGNLVVTAGANVKFSINLYTAAASTTVVESGQLTTYTADVVNNTPVSYTNDLVELKVEFGPSEVSSHDAISVRDSAGNVFTAQFASFFAPNFRKLRDDSKYSDGSFKEGSILFKDSFPSGAKKEYVVMTKGNYSAGSAYPKLTDSGVDKIITVGAYTYKFDGASYYEMKSIKGGLAEVVPLDTSRCQVYINAVTTDVFFFHNPSIKLVNSGPLFSEVERTSYNADTSVLPAGSIRVVRRYRIFADGRIHMRTIFRVETSIAAGILLGVRQDFRIPFTGTAVIQSTGAPAVYLPSSSADGLPYHQVITIANGDISREGETDGPTRPPIADVGVIGGYRSQVGFLITDTAGLSFNNFGYAKGWAWSYEVKLRQNTPFANVADAIKAELNAPVGFLTVGSNLFVEKRRALERFKKYIDAFQDFYTDAEYGLLAKSAVTDWFYPQLFGLLKCLRTGGNFENQYAAFKSFMTANIASDLSTAGSLYLAGNTGIIGRMWLQFHGRMVIAAVEMYYRYAKLKGITAVKTDLEVYIKSMCDAFVTKVTANGFIPLQGNSTATPANNANAEGLRMLGLGIFAGLDTGGSYSAAFDTVVNNMLAQAPSAQGIAPCVIDAPATSLSQNRWLSYDAHVAYVVNRAFKLAGKTKAIDNTNLMLRGIVGSGEMRHIDANVSESRRWGIETVGAIAIALLDARRTSTCGAANKVLDSYDDLWGPNFVANQAIGAFDIAKGFDKATFNMVFNINQLCLPVIDAMLDEL
ncbi:hypothetical protein AB8S16_07780 [Klebsiella pneumoniae]